MRNDKPNLIVNLTFEYSVKIIELCELLESKKKFILANQLFRSGTSVGANTWEAKDAESKADFIHKFKIAAKEANETMYWLLLCKKVESYPDTMQLIGELESIQKITSKIISSSKKQIVKYIAKF
jgi:four helix bundle protein